MMNGSRPQSPPDARRTRVCFEFLQSISLAISPKAVSQLHQFQSCVQSYISAAALIKRMLLLRLRRLNRLPVRRMAPAATIAARVAILAHRFLRRGSGGIVCDAAACTHGGGGTSRGPPWARVVSAWGAWQDLRARRPRSYKDLLSMLGLHEGAWRVHVHRRGSARRPRSFWLVRLCMGLA
jgi:hypothetical protein